MKRTSRPLAIDLALNSFAVVRDPRIDRTKLHPLVNILVMALTGTIAGANGWDELALFAEGHQEWFGRFLDVPHVTPSADTFRRVFEAIDPRELEAALQQWTQAFASALAGQVVAIDGKSLKGASENAGSTTPLHILHAWAADQHLLLGQQVVAGAPGEVRAIPELLKRLRIEDAVVTTDANGCTPAVAEAVREAKADYVLALKGNRGRLHSYVKEQFAEATSKRFRGVATHRTEEKGHGRTEKRVVRAMRIRDWPGLDNWRDLNTAVMVERSRNVAGNSSQEVHYYVSSLEPDATKHADAIRAHWSIENNLHWLLDVAFHEDTRRIRDDRSAENFALLSRLALMLLKRAPGKLSLPMKRRKAAWEPNYLLQVLAAGIAEV